MGVPWFLVASTLGFEFYAERIPNGPHVYVHGRWWHAVGHLLPEATLPQLPRNQFAKDFAHQGYQWTVELCQMDSDGDGVPNGIELGDGNCSWSFGLPHPSVAVGHPGIDERHVPFHGLQISTNIMQRAVPSERDVHRLFRAPVAQSTILLSNHTARGTMGLPLQQSTIFVSNHTAAGTTTTAKPWRFFFDMLPDVREPTTAPFWSAAEEVEDRTAKALLNKVLFLAQFVVFPAAVLMAAWWRFTGPGAHALIKPWGVIAAWLCMYSGIALGSHRLFSHSAFVPSRAFKNFIALCHCLNGQGDPRYWAGVHRRHHNLCEQEGGDPHAVNGPRGFWFAHGGLLWDHFEHVTIETAVPDLMDDDMQFWHDWGVPWMFLGVPILGTMLLWLLHFLLSPRGAATGRTRVSVRIFSAFRFAFVSYAFYFCLPAVMTFHNSMLVNSAVHTVGYVRYRDAMSGPCTGKNVPFLFPFMLGENNHNNHHGAPSSISTWQAWWEVDIWGPAVHVLQLVGLVTSHSDFRQSRMHPESTELGMRRGRQDLIHESEPISFWGWRDDPCPIWCQWAFVLAFYYGMARWRWRNARRPTADHQVTALFTVLPLLSVAHCTSYVFSDPTLLTMEVDPTNWFGDGPLRAFATAVCRLIKPLHPPDAFTDVPGVALGVPVFLATMTLLLVTAMLLLAAISLLLLLLMLPICLAVERVEQWLATRPAPSGRAFALLIPPALKVDTGPAPMRAVKTYWSA